VKRVREEKEAIGQARFRSRQHGGLPPAVGLAAQKDASRNKLSYNTHRPAQPIAVFAAVSSWRSAGAQLSKRKIAAQHRPASVSQLLGQRDEEGRSAIAASSVGENESVA
jgi:hypothetical protein